MSDLTELLTAFGLAAGAGTRAVIPVIALGIFHYTPYFELAPGWLWIADPPVMITLAGLLLLELWAISHPDMGAYAEWASYAPALVAGFIAVAAVTGEVDRSLLELLASGILGGTTSVVVRYSWHRLKREAESVLESTDHARSAAAGFELAAAGAVSSIALIAPALSLALIVSMIAGFAGLSRLLLVNSRCPRCSGVVHHRAIRCPSCRTELSLRA